MTGAPPFPSLVQRLHALHCPFTLDLTELDLCTASSLSRLHLLHFLLASIAPGLAPLTPPTTATPATIEALVAACVAVGACNKRDAANVVCGTADGGWAQNGRVLFTLLELAEARHSSSQPLDSAFDSELSLLSAACSSAVSLLSPELHLFPADVLLTSKQINQQPIGRLLVAHIAELTEAAQTQLATISTASSSSLSSSSSPASSSPSLPALLASAADLSIALPDFQAFHAAHIAPHLASFTGSAISSASAGPLSSSIAAVLSLRSSVSSQLQPASTLCSQAEVGGVCEAACESADGVSLRNDSGGHSFDVGRLCAALRG